MSYISKIKDKFQQLYVDKPILVRSPGRINLIGEHTDYNQGWVLPAAIDKYIYMAVQKRKDEEIHIFSIDYNEEYQASTDSLIHSGKLWPDYILGVVDELKKAGSEIAGFNCVFGGDIPLGAGLSSSAALECVTGFSLNELFDLKLDRLTLVKIAQKAENNFVGLKSGIMDQFASMFGKNGYAIKLDCLTLQYDLEPIKFEGITIVLFDTNVKHSLASSAYNKRRQECEEGVALVKEHQPQVNSLRDVTVDMLDQYVAGKNELVYKRCKFIVLENKRVLEGCIDLENHKLEDFGKKMFATHDGLSKDYEVSCAESDFLVDYVKNNPSVLGARMMGGGFGGCTINLIKDSEVDGLVENISKAYEENMGKELTVHHIRIKNGTEIID